MGFDLNGFLGNLFRDPVHLKQNIRDILFNAGHLGTRELAARGGLAKQEEV